MKIRLKFKKSNLPKLALYLGTPVIALLASCAPSGDVTHTHGALTHTHGLKDLKKETHSHPVPAAVAKKKPSTPKVVKDVKTNTTAKIKPTVAKKSATKKAQPFMGLLHKHHQHFDPTTGAPSEPC